MTFAEVWPAVECVLAPIAVIVGVAAGSIMLVGAAWFGLVRFFDWMRGELG